ncbi:MAG: helix-turn-helix transcriptional regulator [Actinobacteria bacterium]|nr:helix-turn-helix transcriptional regulator [Actinomycetota bacterium]
MAELSRDLMAPPGTLASAPPRREAGTRSRAGNAMARTRSGLLAGALRAVAAHGTRRTTMGDIATHAGLAKATLYNHFRTKEDVWVALVAVEVAQLAEECAGLPLVEALAHAANRIGTHPAVRTVAREEPAVLARMFPGESPSGSWQVARELLAHGLRASGEVGSGDPESAARLATAGEIVLRWLASYLVRPGDPHTIRLAAERLGRLLPGPPRSA